MGLGLRLRRFFSYFCFCNSLCGMEIMGCDVSDCASMYVCVCDGFCLGGKGCPCVISSCGNCNHVCDRLKCFGLLKRQTEPLSFAIFLEKLFIYLFICLCFLQSLS